MEIIWLGRNCFRLRGRDGTVLTDPCPPNSGYRIGKQAADVVTVSRRDDPGYSYVSAAAQARRVLDAPGEFEIGGTLVRGVAVREPDGSRNLIFICELDGVKVGHLGLLKTPPPAAIMNQLEDIDVLLIPVGGHNGLPPAVAQDLMTSIAPSIAIPMNYLTDVEKLPLESVEKFLSETGARPEPEQRLNVSRSSLPDELTLHLLIPRT